MLGDCRRIEPSSDQFGDGKVEAEAKIFLLGQANRICRLVGKSIIEIGNDLLRTKQYLLHGALLRWVESKVGIPARTAQGYMKVLGGPAAKVRTSRVCLRLFSSLAGPNNAA